MLQQMPASVFVRWAIYWQMRPSGETAADMRAAIVPTMLANMMRQRGRTAIKPEQFMLAVARPAKKTQTPNEIEAALRRAHPKEWAAYKERKANECQQ